MNGLDYQRAPQRQPSSLWLYHHLGYEIGPGRRREQRYELGQQSKLDCARLRFDGSIMVRVGDRGCCDLHTNPVVTP
jgi:hypothetical protein